MYDIWGVVMSYEIYVEGVMVYAGFRCVAGLRGRVWLSSAGFSRSFLWLETFLSRQPRCMIQNVSLQKSGKRVEQRQSKCAGRVSAKPQAHFHPIPVIYARNLRP